MWYESRFLGYADCALSLNIQMVAQRADTAIVPGRAGWQCWPATKWTKTLMLPEP